MSNTAHNPYIAELYEVSAKMENATPAQIKDLSEEFLELFDKAVSAYRIKAAAYRLAIQMELV